MLFGHGRTVYGVVNLKKKKDFIENKSVFKRE